MKMVLAKLAILMTAVSLVSCATNTQNQNTAVGAVSGGVIGAVAGGIAGGGGAALGVGVLGALIGGVIGHEMDSSDKSATYTSVSSGHDADWVNSKTHNHYTVYSSGHYITVNGNPFCRKYTTIAKMHGKSHKFHGIACRQSDGSWKTVNN